LLCHTGGEQSLPNLDKSTASPDLLIPALKRGVKVIMAHCGTRSKGSESDFVPHFVRLAKEYEHCYGDTAALNLPTRSYAYETILNDPIVRDKILHGSDWPILPVPPMKIGLFPALKAWAETNWIKRDVEIKRKLGFDENYWNRAGKLLLINAGTHHA
jgi:predicted TIM-barrel fold metal-dependent hydrolase